MHFNYNIWSLNMYTMVTVSNQKEESISALRVDMRKNLQATKNMQNYTACKESIDQYMRKRHLSQEHQFLGPSNKTGSKIDSYFSHACEDESRSMRFPTMWYVRPAGRLRPACAYAHYTRSLIRAFPSRLNIL